MKITLPGPKYDQMTIMSLRPARNIHIILLASNANKIFSNFCKLWPLINWPFILKVASH